MRLYITVWDDGRSDRNYRFTGTQADQRKLNKEIDASGDVVVRSEEVEVPSDKAGLLTFLNDFQLARADAAEQAEAA